MTVKRWVTPSSAAVADHGFTALSHFVINVLLVRWMLPETYGEFVLGWTVLLLIGAVHTGFVVNPMLVLASAQHRQEAPVYLGRVAVWQFTSFAGFSVVIAITALLAIDNEQYAVAVVAGSAAAPFFYSLWTLRKATYVSFSPHIAALYSGVYLVLSVGGVVLLERASALTPVSALLGLGAASSVSCAAFLAGTRGSVLRLTSERSPAARKAVVRAHWDYGKWAAPSWLLDWTSQHIFYLILPFSLGTASVQTLKAGVTALAPVIQPLQALSSLMVAGLAAVRDTPNFDRLLRTAVLGSFTCGLVVWIGFAAWHDPMLRLLYGPDFSSPPGLFLILGGLPLFSGVSLFAICALLARERTRDVFLTLLAAAIATLAVGLPLSARTGVMGAAAGLLAGTVVRSLVAHLLQNRQGDPGEIHAPPVVVVES